MKVNKRQVNLTMLLFIGVIALMALKVPELTGAAAGIIIGFLLGLFCANLNDAPPGLRVRRQPEAAPETEHYDSYEPYIRPGGE